MPLQTASEQHWSNHRDLVSRPRSFQSLIASFFLQGSHITTHIHLQQRHSHFQRADCQLPPANYAPSKGIRNSTMVYHNNHYDNFKI